MNQEQFPKGSVEINATDYSWTSPTITASDIRRLGNIPANHNVYREIAGPEDDPQVMPGEAVDIHQFRKFYSVSSSIAGGCAHA